MRSNEHPKVSVIIPVYNVSDYVGACLESVLVQTLKDMEIIVVNDGSTDGSAEIVAQIAATDSRVVLVNKPNGGVTSAREKGVEMAKGQYIFFLDGDDRLHSPDSLSIMFDKANEMGADFVAGDFRIVFPDGRGFVRKFAPYSFHNSQEALKYAFLNNDFYYTGRLIKKEIAQYLIGKIPHDITYGEDTYAVVNLLSRIGGASKVDAIVLDYVQRASSVTNRLSKEDQRKRNKAINLTLQFAEDQKMLQFAEAEITVYALREIYQSIILGCANEEAARKYLHQIRKIDKDYKAYLSRKVRMVLNMALLSMPVACGLISTIKTLK